MTGRIVVLLACALAGCTHPALARFQTEHGCTSATIDDLGAHAYRVRGCGRVINYVCDPRAYNEAVCIEERASAEGATASVVDREDHRTSTAPRLRLQEGAVQGAQAVRLSIPQLGGAELLYAPGIDRENVVGRAAPRIAARCADAHAAVDDGYHAAAVRGAGAFAWARELFAAVERSHAVTIIMCGQRAELRDTIWS